MSDRDDPNDISLFYGHDDDNTQQDADVDTGEPSSSSHGPLLPRPSDSEEDLNHRALAASSRNQSTADKINRVMSRYTWEELAGKENKTDEEKDVRRILSNRRAALNSRNNKKKNQNSLVTINDDLASQLFESHKTIDELTNARDEKDQQALTRDQYILSLETRLTAMENLFIETGGVLPSSFSQQQSWFPSEVALPEGEGGDNLWTDGQHVQFGDGSFLGPDMTQQDSTQMDHEQ
ncbi:hypothetical protein L198_06625 [Cryptococcus wingfieldii CBS 7118]|uniref:BZIP domain-containing protein n=1 Tax=Cryptococcus wingfieldii CBS 7118 TaxID=1295528 RepID=A0A1E3IJQ8_9TREE|nr:hypothetical protein L198_06625 [Cryptococcus wingfieldii CBS 7118]ODN88823.1 hypothetical protein L198_06625 [Cryptococcus wingfieldii CBS 7118]